MQFWLQVDSSEAIVHREGYQDLSCGLGKESANRDIGFADLALLVLYLLTEKLQPRLCKICKPIQVFGDRRRR